MILPSGSFNLHYILKPMAKRLDKSLSLSSFVLVPPSLVLVPLSLVLVPLSLVLVPLSLVLVPLSLVLVPLSLVLVLTQPCRLEARLQTKRKSWCFLPS